MSTGVGSFFDSYLEKIVIFAKGRRSGKQQETGKREKGVTILFLLSHHHVAPSCHLKTANLQVPNKRRLTSPLHLHKYIYVCVCLSLDNQKCFEQKGGRDANRRRVGCFSNVTDLRSVNIQEKNSVRKHTAHQFKSFHQYCPKKKMQLSMFKQPISQPIKKVKEVSEKWKRKN